ncbi:MAG: hypothetical protein JSV47_06775 [Deltaproteobacteria bacterium]|nr:MAG: hypothetical protein JSV47_06775 [Deltaproteobacteria bacterium]
MIFISVLLGVISGVIYGLNFNLGQVFPRLNQLSTTHLFLLQFLFLNVLYLLVVYIVFKQPDQTGSSHHVLLIILLFGIFFRLCLIRATPVLSSDIYRYVWDGRVQAQGINPYVHPPSSDSLNSLRDEVIYPHINRPASPTIYPAGAQIFFLFSHWIGGGGLKGLKIVLVFFDVLTMIVLIALLRTHGLQESRFIVYGWNPLVIIEIAHSGHLEGLIVFLVVLAFFLHSRNRKTLGVLSLACASATKIYPVLLLPAFINRGERLKSLLVFFSTILLLYLPYSSAGKKMLGFLPVYFKNPYESFNLGIKYFLMGMFHGLDYFLLTKIFAGIILAAGVFIFLKHKGNEEVLKYSYIMISLQLIFMPAALHPWYVVWLIPLLAFYPSPAWLVFSGTVALSYLKYVSPTGIMPKWVLYLEYLPLFGLLIMEYLWRQHANRRWFPWRPKDVTV